MPIATPHQTKKITGAAMLKLRGKLNVNQSEFWLPLGVTQSAGSRYESGGRDIPEPLRIAIAHTYNDEIKRHKRAIFSA